MIIKVFVAQGRSEEALAQYLLHQMVHPERVALVVKAVRQFRTQPEVGIDLAQQQRAGIAGESAAGEIGLHFAGSQVIEKKGLIGCEHVASL